MVFSRGVSEPNILELNFTSEGFRVSYDFTFFVLEHVDFAGFVCDGEDSFGCFETLGCGGAELLGLAGCECAEHDAENADEDVLSVHSVFDWNVVLSFLFDHVGCCPEEDAVGDKCHELRESE